MFGSSASRSLPELIFAGGDCDWLAIDSQSTLERLNSELSRCRASFPECQIGMWKCAARCFLSRYASAQLGGFKASYCLSLDPRHHHGPFRFTYSSPIHQIANRFQAKGSTTWVTVLDDQLVFAKWSVVLKKKRTTAKTGHWRKLICLMKSTETCFCFVMNSYEFRTLCRILLSWKEPPEDAI